MLRKVVDKMVGKVVGVVGEVAGGLMASAETARGCIDSRLQNEGCVD